MSDKASPTGLNRASISMVLQVMLLLSVTKQANCSRVEKKFTKILNNRILTTFDQVTATSGMTCCLKCNVNGSTCTGVNFRKATGQCELSSVALKDVAAGSVTEAGWVTYSRADPADWIVAFHAMSDIGTDVYQAWMSGAGTTSHDVTCMLPDVTSCNAHFRNKLVDSWQALDVIEVRVSLYKNQAEVAYVLFDGTGSSLTSWFAPQRVLSSTWIGIDNPLLVNAPYFTVLGLPPTRPFLISQYFGGCPDDPVVLMVLTGDYYWCPYDKHSTYPKFIYSVSNTWANLYFPGQFDFADSFMISIRTS